MSIGSIGSTGCNPLQQAMQQLFSKSDANTDGKLDSSEISSMLDALQEVSSTSASSDSSLTADSVVSAFDTDGDGAVSGSEFDAGFKKLAEEMQSTMIAMQESGQRPSGPPPGPPPESSDDEDEDDSSTSTVSDLMKLLESYSSSATGETASTDEDSTTTTSADSLAQIFLKQLEKYAKNQDYQSTYLSQYASQTSSVSLSA